MESIGVRQRLITLEGIDGAGKSTHIKAMAQLLQEQGGS
ncbi:MAG: dTMP kinase, partial [Betaproteobacteria bacterium]|nr:dTMP kinase [Betaproteobacteria bacterium]